MSSEEITMLEEIQRLAIAAHQQTGIANAFSSYTTELLDGTLNHHASVVIMPEGEKPWSMNGTSSRYPSERDTTLEGLRDQLAEFVAKHRKEEAA